MKAAIRHLLRNRRRSLLTLLAVLIPTYILVVMLGMVAGEMRGMFDSTVKFETGHFQIQREADRPAGGALPLIDDPAPLLAIVDRTEGIAWRTVRLDLPALAASEDQSYGVVVQGVVPEEIGRISPIPELITDGVYLSAGATAAVIGGELRDLLDVEVGDPVILLGAHPSTGIGVAKPTVVGVFEAPEETLGRSLVQVDIDRARQLAKRGNAATAIVGYVAGVAGPWDAWKIERVVEALRGQMPEGYQVLTWRELSPDVNTYLRIARPLLTAFSAIFFVLGGLVVLNTLYLSVMERTRELGMIIALGASRRRVMGMVLTEAGLIAVVGGTIGALCGAGLVWLIEGLGGLRLPVAYSGFMKAVGMEPILHVRITPIEIIGSALAMIAVAILSAWYPAHRASRLEPMEAMRHVD